VALSLVQLDRIVADKQAYQHVRVDRDHSGPPLPYEFDNPTPRFNGCDGAARARRQPE
jgi:hypothetical protein